MKKTRAFSPGHITGFFQICDDSENLLEKGSRGAGVSVSRGVTTTIEAKPANAVKIKIAINGDISSPAPVSRTIATRFLELGPSKPYEVQINHQVELPIGSGFGTSGAGALSLALAMKEVMELDLSTLEAAQIAHIAEVQHRTGLGSVIAELVGGIEIRSIAGGPGVGQVETLPNSNEYKVVCLPFGPIPTPLHLNNPNSRRLINERGGILTDALRANPTVSNFLEYSRNFAEHIGIITKRVNAVLQEADDDGIVCSSAIFGENVFSIVGPDQIQDLTRIFEHHKISENQIMVMEIDCEGARVIDA
ncbi:MAG: pantoate kinase [Promethearchaeota archaeon]